jgi:hypothetical protein
MRSTIRGGAIAGAILMGLAGAPAVAQESEAEAEPTDAAAGTVSIELNKLEDRDNACRAYFVVENGTDIAFTELRLDLYIFDTEGEIFRRLLLDPGEIAPDKTRVMLFDATEIDCGGIGRFLLDGVLSCADTDGSREDCADLLTLSSRLETPFED